MNLFGASDDENENPKENHNKNPQAHLKKKTSNKAKMTSEEYKLQNNSVKKRNKKREFEKGGKPDIPDVPKLVSAESTNSEKKQPLMITKIVMKDKKEEFKMSIEDLVEQEYKNIEESSNKIEALNRENDEGNDEYKLKLVGPSPEKFQNLTTQMKFRLNEGLGECFYKIGVEDNGNPLGIPKEMMILSLRTLCNMASCLKAEVILLRMRKGIKGNYAELMVRQGQKEGIKLDIRIMLLGDFESGKSTLVGVLTSGTHDNGKGLARMKVLCHKHEVLSGQTSSLSHHILGFDSEGNIVNHSSLTNSSWEEIVDMSTKILTFIDIGGHEKYSKTLVSGFCSQYPEYALLVVSVLQGISKVTEQHIQMANLFQIPLIVVFTHLDLATEAQIDDTLIQMKNFLKIEMPNKFPIIIKTVEDIVLVSRTLFKENPVPIFLVSNLTGKNLDLFKGFLNLLPVVNPFENYQHMNTEFYVDQKYEVNGQTIISGTVIKGSVKKNQVLSLGPDNKGLFHLIEIQAIKCKRVDVRSATCGQNCTLAIKLVKPTTPNPFQEIRRGMVLVEEKTNPRSAFEFLAEIYMYDHSIEDKILRSNYQPVVNSQNTRQACKLIITEDNLLNVSPELKKMKSKSIEPRGFKDKTKSKNACKKNYEIEENGEKKIKHKGSMDCMNEKQMYYGKKIRKEGEKLRKESFEEIKEKEDKKTLIEGKYIVLNHESNNFIRLRFKYFPEYINIGQKLIINDNCLKAIGWIREIYY